MHIESPELASGSIADVSLIPETPAAPTAALTSLIGAAAGGGQHAAGGRYVHSSSTKHMARLATLTGRLYLDTNYLYLRVGRLPGLSTNLNAAL